MKNKKNKKIDQGQGKETNYSFPIHKKRQSKKVKKKKSIKFSITQNTKEDKG